MNLITYASLLILFAASVVGGILTVLGVLLMISDALRLVL